MVGELPKPRNFTKADIYVLPGVPPVLVKDYSRRNLAVRLYGRFCLHNEEKALKRLAGIKGVPAFCGRISRYAIAMEYVDGKPLSELRRSGGVPPDFGDRLALLFEAIESRGVVHGDAHLRNILCGEDGQPYLIDFSFCYFRGMVPLLDGWIVRNLRVDRERKLRKVRRVFCHEDVGGEPRPGLFFRLVLSLKRLYRFLRQPFRRSRHSRRR